MVSEVYYYSLLPDGLKWGELDFELSDFLKRLQPIYNPFLPQLNYKILQHPNSNLLYFYESSRSTSYTSPPILMTEPVLAGFKRANPEDLSVKKGWWTSQNLTVLGYNGKIYGGDVIFLEFKA